MDQNEKSPVRGAAEHIWKEQAECGDCHLKNISSSCALILIGFLQPFLIITGQVFMVLSITGIVV